MRNSSTTNNTTARSSSHTSLEPQQDFNHGTWMSLLGLLNPWEFFVTVDKTTLWRRHVAWAKPMGKEIRDYTTQQFASNIVFLSLLLGSEMSVFLNSSLLLTEIRQSLENQEYGSLKYYIGCIIIIDICVTLLGLVATFTAWSMIAALSDSNSHAILRSSMGQYVTSLPMRLVVASLYLFLLWIVLIIINLMKGPVPYLIVATVGFMFFQMVSSLSCFGRLIIHTGAMGQKRVLDPEFERHLLPSGLHASLLIKASERARRRTSATAQYQKNTNNSNGSATKTSMKSKGGLSNSDDRTSPRASSDEDMPPQPPLCGLRRNPTAGSTRSGGVGDGGGLANSVRSDASPRHCSHGDDDEDEDDDSLSEEDHTALLLSARAFGSHTALDTADTKSSSFSHQQKYRPMLSSYGATATTTTGNKNAAHRHFQHQNRQRALSTDTVESLDDLCHDVFPRPSVLNRVCSTQLKNVVKQALEKTQQQEQKAHQQQQHGDTPFRPNMRKLAKEQQESSARQLVAQRKAKSTAVVAQLRQEWTDEEQVRDLYGYEPPVQIDLNLNGSDDDDDDADEPSDFKMMPRISLLNRSTRLRSLRNLLTFRGTKNDDIDDNDGNTSRDRDSEPHGCIGDHVGLSCIEERGDDTDSSTRDFSSTNYFSSSESSGMDAATHVDSRTANSTTSSPRSRKNKRYDSLPISGSSISSALSTVVNGHSALSAGDTSSTSNTTPLLQDHYGQKRYSSSVLYDGGDEDEETGGNNAAKGMEVERQHLLAPR